MIVSQVSAQGIRSAPLRAVRIVVGAWALAIDAVADTLRDPGTAVEHVELRGVRVQRTLRRRWQSIGRESGAELSRLTDSALEPVRWMQREVTSTSNSSSEELERQVERMLDRLGIPSRERLDRLTREIEALSARIDQELASLEAAEKAPLH